MALPHVAQRESLVIHFVRAASYEIDGLGMMDSEELLHRLPKLKVLNLHHVGPEIFPEVAQSYSDRTRNWACALCKPKDWGRFNFPSSLPYYDYLAQNLLPKPDLVVGLILASVKSQSSPGGKWSR
jgi:hypothetical protein